MSDNQIFDEVSPEKGTISDYYCDCPEHENEELLHDGDGGYYCEACDGETLHNTADSDEEDEEDDEDDDDCICHECGKHSDSAFVHEWDSHSICEVCWVLKCYTDAK
jgi:hypothetical protein